MAAVTSNSRRGPGRPSRVQMLPLFRSDAQARILSLLYLSGKEWTLTELARHIGLTKSSTLREVDRLTVAGILDSRSPGRDRLVSAGVQGPLRTTLEQLALHAYGPVQVIGQEFSTVPGVSSVQIYGSWAARYQGVAGPPPSDIDVLVIGDVSRDQVFDAAERATNRLGIGVEVSAHPVTAQAWEHSTSAFVATVKNRPRVEVELIPGDMP